jgi:2-amino-4-hydroxy-6-hydroxymethyldihydropteridine diphosphokinase
MAGLRQLSFHGKLRKSQIYETEPWGVEDQPLYLNAVVEIYFTGSPEQLLEEIQALEAAAGRIRDGERWAARTLDIDILLFGDYIIDSEVLKIPHPLMTERRFVLQPLADLAPELALPGMGMTVAEKLARCQ